MISEGVWEQRLASAEGLAGRDRLPSGLRLLCVGSSEPSWVSLTLQLDARGSAEPRFRWAASPGEALTLLRDESFDCLLLRYQPLWDRESQDPLALARAVRAGGSADPIVVVTQTSDDDAWSEAIAINVDLLVTPRGWESTALIPAIERAITCGHLQADLNRHAAAERTRLLRDRGEAEALLAQQRQIVDALQGSGHDELLSEALSSDGERAARDETPPELESYYQELLRAYVMMSSGSLSGELRKLAGILADSGMPPRRVLRLHLRQLERLVEGLGTRSSRHVLGRASLLALELLAHLGEVNGSEAP